MVKSLEANKLFKDDPLFKFIKQCYENNVPSLFLLSKLTSTKSFIIINQKLPQQIWKALNECMELFAEKDIDHLYLQDSYLDNTYFP